VSGERPGYREAMERMQRQLQQGGMPADKARQVAQETARKQDRRETDKGR
jgi:ribosomal protein S16